MLRRAAALLLAGATMLTLAACAPPAQAPQPGTTAPAGDATGGAPDAPPTCSTIIPATLVADFEEYGLTAIEEPFAFGDPATTTIEGGITCKWGNPDVPTDHGVQIYGWAPMDEAGHRKWAAFLTEQGWKPSKGDALEYFGDPFAEGGMTYAFGDGFVIVADTRDSLPLVSFPAS
jgi:hypothetical protein